MKTLTKEEILNSSILQFDEHDISYQHQVAALQAMQSFSDQENARLTAISAKQAELINKQKGLIYELDKQPNSIGEEWRIRVESIEWNIIDLESALQSLQSVKEATAMEQVREAFEPIQMGANKVPGNKCIGVDCGKYNDKK